MMTYWSNGMGWGGMLGPGVPAFWGPIIAGMAVCRPNQPAAPAGHRRSSYRSNATPELHEGDHRKRSRVLAAG
ncbi:hypothetical protein [Catellatospora tritici]|uniref:hypothetical protein n=1 Tax=Catellatospora tritici TaxID=2851566 RepID=UPI001C2D2A00|nr:hypothetical protein [Catellatospora tritici]MBV1856383.1 hypothetical protein [Catellatospora tritici]